MIKKRNLCVRHIPADIMDDVHPKRLQHDVLPDGSLVVFDQKDRLSGLSVDDFKLRTLLDAGVNLDIVSSIDVNRLALAGYVASEFDNIVNLERQLQSFKSDNQTIQPKNLSNEKTEN